MLEADMNTPIWKYFIPRRDWDGFVRSPPEPIVGDYRIEITFRGDLAEVVFYWRSTDEPLR